jgi:hypothetical protein
LQGIVEGAQRSAGGHGVHGLSVYRQR